MKQWFISKLVSLAGGVSGIIEWLCDWFNKNVLQKVKDKEEFAAYADDVDQFGTFLDGVFTRHSKWMSEAKRAAAKATIDAVRNLATALKDCNVTKDEIDAFVDAVVAAIEAWKAAK